MNIDIIIQKINNGEYETKLERPKIRKYSENHVFDENKTVKWNREEVIRRNTESSKEMERYKKSINEGSTKFKEDVVNYLTVDYEIDNNKQIAELIYALGYSEGHSTGMKGTLDEVTHYADFAEEVLSKYREAH